MHEFPAFGESAIDQKEEKPHINVPMEGPGKLGYTMPAEWDRHRGTILTWPQRNGVSFPPPYDAGVAETYIELIEHLSAVEEVHINLFDDYEIGMVEKLLAKSKADRERVFLHHHPSYEPWCRDHGPIVVKHRETGEIAVTDWKYNAWGDKYPPYDLDNTIPARMAEVLGCRRFVSDMVLEGGSIEVNGCGDLVTTEACLLNPNRNPDMNRQQIEARLRDFLGVDRIHWLGDGIEGDDTDGHIDDLTRFVDESTLVTVMEHSSTDPNAAILRENRDRLEAIGRFEIIDLPMPDPVILDGHRLPASYANFYIANELVLVPTFNQTGDEKALGILRDCFPGRKVCGVDSRALIFGLGSFHCITQQIPA